MQALSLRNIITLFLIAFSLFFFSTSVAQNNERPKIGLVLSGGGAKGIAHIGVLKAMERAGLTPDYITGTSMGSIIGGLYAAGYSPDELEELVLGANWGELLSNKIPYNKVTYEEKEYYGRYLLDFYIEDWQLQIPKGIIEGQGLNQLFSDLTRPVQDINDFSKLPTPFKCVAADIVTGKAVVLDHGSLAMSMRASMAIPSVFTPVRLDSHLLVDGGILRNMPVQEAKDMGADIIIGVFVSSDLDAEEDLKSAISILSQSIFITSAFDTREQLKMCDYLVSPNLASFATGSFGEAQAILDSGITAGDRSYAYFKNLADSLKQFGPLHKGTRIKKPETYTFQRINIYGTKNFSEGFIKNRLNIKVNKSISIDKLNEQIELLYGTLYFEKLWYEINLEQDSLSLNVYLIERPQNELRFSYHYDSENKGGVVTNLTLRNVLLKKSRFIFEADLASFPRVTIDYLKYLGYKKTFAIQTIGTYDRSELPSFDDEGNTTSIFTKSQFTAGARIQTTRFQNGAFGVEAFHTDVNYKPKIAESSLRVLSKIHYSSSKFSAFYRFNSFNDRYFPTKGLSFEVMASTSANFNGDIHYEDSTFSDDIKLDDLLQTSKIQGIKVIFFPIYPISKSFSLLLKTKLRISTLLPDNLNLDEYDLIGGFNPNQPNSTEFYGLNIGEIGSANYFYGRFSIQYNLKSKYFVQSHFNIIDFEEVVSLLYPNAVTDNYFEKNYTVGIGGTLGYYSPFGPISVSVAKDLNRDNIKSTLVIGFYF